jgi:ATP-dependent DNA ligase
VKHDTFFTREGIVGGKITESLPTVCYGKNIDKKNETTPFEQAELEAQAKWQKKLDSGYNLVLTTEKKFVEPMLAFEFSKYPIDWKKEKIVFVQPKLDGLRAINENNTLMSRNGKPYVAPHLHQNEFTLDGELYNHSLKDNFNKIVSLFKKQKPTEKELAECAEIGQYWVYDMPNAAGGFGKRYFELLKWHANLTEAQRKIFKVVPTKIITSQDQLDECHAEYLAGGFEGTIIRRDNVEYEFKRSKQLLKYKDFIDEEFEILGYEEGEGGRTGTIGFFIMKHDKVPGQTFKSNVKGNFDYLKEVWQNRDAFIGKTATVKYFNRTPLKEDGGDVPRFPFIIKINREAYE